MAEKQMRKAGEGSITYMKDGRVRLRVSNGSKLVVDNKTGERKRVKNLKDFIGHSEEEVIEKFEKWKEQKQSNDPDKYKDRLLMECIFEWLNNVKRMQLKPGSFARLLQVTEDNVSPRFGIYKVGEITPDLIQTNLISDLWIKGMSHSTIKKSVNILTGFFKWAVSTNKVQYNPTIALVIPSDKRIKEQQGKEDKIEYYTKEEIKRFKAAADDTDKFCREVDNYRFPRSHVYLFMIYTGLRLGEMLALKWNDYNPERGTISVSKNVIEYKDPDTKKIVTQIQLTTKTDSSTRILPLNEEAKKELQIIKERSFNPNNEFVVSNRKIKGMKDYVAPSNFRNAFRRFCDYAGVEYKKVHALRHTFATLMFAQGVDIKYISAWLGHSSVQITYDTYVHIMEEFGNNNKPPMPDIKLD